MKGLFGGRGETDFRKELDDRGIVKTEEKPVKKQQAPSASGDLNAFLGEGTTFKGNLTFEGTVRVDGRMEGEIRTKDTLVIGQSAAVQADIYAGALVISGTVHGNITAGQKVELHASARLFGNIATPSLVMAEGVIFEGSCTMGNKGAKPEVVSRPAESKQPSSPPQKVEAK
jgi:cytoskeletal protein CcmA (bactofilin family)